MCRQLGSRLNFSNSNGKWWTDNLAKRVREMYRTDNAVVLFFVEGIGLAYASPNINNGGPWAVIFSRDPLSVKGEVFAHEILHLFGARDE